MARRGEILSVMVACHYMTLFLSEVLGTEAESKREQLKNYYLANWVVIIQSQIIMGNYWERFNI